MKQYCSRQHDTITDGTCGGSTLGISGWGCAAGTLQPFKPIPELFQLNFATVYTRVNSPNTPYPRVAVFQKLLRSLAHSSQNTKPYTTIISLSKNDLFILVSLFSIFPGFLSLDKIFNQLVSFVKNDTLF